MSRQITLHTGRIVHVGMIPSTRERLARAHSMHNRLRGIKAAAQCFNTLGVHSSADMDGNGPPRTANDQSYTGQPLGDCAAVAFAKRFGVVSVRQGGPEVEINAKAVADWYLGQSPGDDGLNIDDAATALKTVPMIDTAGVGHTVGEHRTMDWTDQNAMMQALTGFFCIDTGMDSSCLEGVVGDDGWLDPYRRGEDIELRP